MKIQKLIRSKEEKENSLEFLKNWQELKVKFSEESVEGSTLLTIEVPEEEFKKLRGIFSSESEAMGAFLTASEEHGWEVVPRTYLIYHAQFDGNKVIAGIKYGGKVSIHDQLHLEEMIRTMTMYPRIVTYNTEPLTYIKDLYPEVDRKTYVIAREIARKGKRAPDLSELGMIYGVKISNLKDSLNLIEKLLKNPIITPEGKVNVRPFYLPII
jgi:hypothetical protein